MWEPVVRGWIWARSVSARVGVGDAALVAQAGDVVWMGQQVGFDLRRQLPGLTCGKIGAIDECRSGA